MDEIKVTIAFKVKDKAAFDGFWAELRERYNFCGDSDVPVQAFAASMFDLFEVNEALTDILNAEDLDNYDKLEAIGELNGSTNPATVLEIWGITRPSLTLSSEVE